ncbi:M20/M25/M40 family metallo-hydrolase [Mucilaginibacter sp. UR6-1]|uniref:M20/M25/M40 family metallo-hydrolase n=1 Tax=Mucilaginibacter sp. UR6-1 TaxID=1435643 RepID=UPI001E5D3786|nr:M20/M25/M40 family metallo-hydrolase [Mucilaginibacter sp. UR6-1]MCC8409490.1 M20/M25/M40 family metallo-hydrolase [Mucilaginibacter sp. UR6-1]
MEQVLIHPVVDDAERIDNLADDALKLLTRIIATPSFSGEEHGTAALITDFLYGHHIPVHRNYNNIWAFNKYYDPAKPTILLNSHHDTVKPNEGYTCDPFEPVMADGRLYGLGSNDAGGCLVSLLSVFVYFYDDAHLPFNLCIAATGEEENSGYNGLNAVLPQLGNIAFAIVGEPTQMHMATAEMGNMVLDCVCYGKPGHAARNEGDNAVYKALKAIQWFSTYQFPKQPAFMWPVKMSVTQINAGIQHNIIPHECRFTVDVRLNSCYTADEVLDVIKSYTGCEITVRPGVMQPSSISHIHPLVLSGIDLGRKTYVSPTSSDQGWLTVPSMKMGPGDSARSHMADEYIFMDEIREGINVYIHLLNNLVYRLIHNPELPLSYPC